MKRFAIVKLKNNSNSILMETTAASKKDAIQYFQSFFTVTNVPNDPKAVLRLDDDGYLKMGEVTFTVAEFWY